MLCSQKTDLEVLWKSQLHSQTFQPPPRQHLFHWVVTLALYFLQTLKRRKHTLLPCEWDHSEGMNTVYKSYTWNKNAHTRWRPGWLTSCPPSSSQYTGGFCPFTPRVFSIPYSPPLDALCCWKNYVKSSHQWTISCPGCDVWKQPVLSVFSFPTPSWMIVSSGTLETT